MKCWSAAAAVSLAVILHQDTWLWHNATLVFGFLPAGLAYHLGYTVLVSLLMAGMVRWLWPAHLEEAEPVRNGDEAGGRA